MDNIIPGMWINVLAITFLLNYVHVPVMGIPGPWTILLWKSRGHVHHSVILAVDGEEPKQAVMTMLVFYPPQGYVLDKYLLLCRGK